jgi:biotin synthase
MMTDNKSTTNTIRNDWSVAEVEKLFSLPFADLLFQAQLIHRQNHDPNAVQVSCLLSVKTGACPENCAYCPQSAHYDTGVKAEKFWAVTDIVEQAKNAKNNGATRFCMGASWRDLPDREVPKVAEMITAVKALGLETCLTAGMLTEPQAQTLKQSGLDYYNHNLDTSPEFYDNIITTRTYEERINTLTAVREAGISVCCGGILGMGEAQSDRVGLLLQLANLPQHPESVPINQLIPIPGTPLADAPPVHSIDFARTIAVARIMMPKSFIRLSAGRVEMSDEMQALCFLAGANSIHTGEKLLVTKLEGYDADVVLFNKLGIHSYQPEGFVADSVTA